MEWARGCWIHQKKSLETDSGLNWMCTSFGSLHTGESDDSRDWMAGNIHQAGYMLCFMSVGRWQWMFVNLLLCRGCHNFSPRASCEDFWDGSADAGPAQRPAEPFQVAAPTMQVLTFDGQKLQHLVSNQLVESESGSSCSCVIEWLCFIILVVWVNKLHCLSIEAASGVWGYPSWKEPIIGEANWGFQRGPQHKAVGQQ